MTRATPSGPPSAGRQMGARTTPGRSRRLRGLMLPVLMIFAAIAVDISRWYVELQRLQRAADAGALAAAPFMPSNLAREVEATRAACWPWPRTATR